MTTNKNRRVVKRIYGPDYDPREHGWVWSTKARVWVRPTDPRADRNAR